MIPNADLGNRRAKLGIYHFFKTVNVFTVSLSGGLFAVFRLKVFFFVFVETLSVLICILNSFFQFLILCAFVNRQIET